MNNKILKQIKIPTSLMIISYFVLMIMINFLWGLGLIINNYIFSCHDTYIGQQIPCYALYDIIVMAILLIIFILSIILILYRIIKNNLVKSSIT